MAMFIILTLLSLLPNLIYGNNTDSSITTYENSTELVKLFDNKVLKCPNKLSEGDINNVIWYYDTIKLSVTANQPESNDVKLRIKNGVNASLVIENVQYNDSKVYRCEIYGTTILTVGQIWLIVSGPPMSFNSFSYEALSDSVLKLLWAINITIGNNVQKYNLTICKSFKTDECQTVSLYHPHYEYIFKNLKPYSDYDVSIIAINDIGINNKSTLKAKTNPGLPIAHPLLSLKVTRERNITMRIDCQDCLSQEKMRGILSNFSVTYIDRGEEFKLVWPTKNATIEKTIVNLRPYTNYTFFVSASNEVKSGSPSSLNCMTKEAYPNPSTFLRSINVTSNDIVVKWKFASDEHGPIIGYILKVTDQSDNIEKTIELDRTVDQYHIERLTAKRSYKIKLAAKNSAGLSQFEELLETTDRAAPSPPRLNQVKMIEDLFIRVAWKNSMPLDENVELEYDICWTWHQLQNLKRKCLSISSSGSGLPKCVCLFNSTIHSVDIPKVLFNITDSRIYFWVELSVKSSFCTTSHCKIMKAKSETLPLEVNDSLPSNKGTRSLFSHTIIIVLTIGCIIFIGGIVVLFCLCGNRTFKQLCSPRSMNSHYSRTSGEYIEVYPRQASQPKILPLEKNPYPPIQVKDLIDHILNYRCDDGAGFQTEFEAIELMDVSRWNITIPNLKDNKAKNRYTNIFPYDHSRVTIQSPPNGKSDYINASFIDGYSRRNAYIATQGPLPDTIGDFWQMVYEQNSEIIVMISNFDERGRRKCEMYWVPNKVVCYGNISVRQIYHKIMAFYTERRFAIKNVRNKKNANKERTIYHYQYTDWRDFDVPPSSLPVLVFVKATTKHLSANSGPIIVHCSAGVGRTGTYICIESQIRQMELEHRINVRGFLEHIRQQRMKLVQTESQYTFIHDALYEYYLCPDHEIHKDILSSYIFQLKETDFGGFSKLDEQFQMCTQFEPSNYDYIECKKSYNLSKNRSKILPIESRRINLSCDPGIEGSNYINGSAIQGYWDMKEFIITQHPLEETERDLWKMVWDENCTVIILLSNEDLPPFWPAYENDSRNYPWSRVNYCNFEESGNISQYEFLLSSPREDYALDCKMHRLKRWPSNISETVDLLLLLFKVNTEKDHSPMVVIDDFGGSKAGIFVALSSLLNQLHNDDSVDVYFVMKMIHMERPYTFADSDDLKFVYELIEHIIVNQSSYPFFSSGAVNFTPNGVCHPPSAVKPNPNHCSFISQYATLNTMRSKSSTSTSRRRASSAESGPFASTNRSPVKSRGTHNRTSWNPGETRYSAVTDSFLDWSSSIGNGHYSATSAPVGTVQIIGNPINDLPVARIVVSQSPLGQHGVELAASNSLASSEV